MATPYIEIFNRDGVCVERMAQGCARYSRKTELNMLENGYTIKINGKKLTKKELREDANKA